MFARFKSLSCSNKDGQVIGIVGKIFDLEYASKGLYTSKVRINTPLFLFHPPCIPPSQPLVVFHWTASSFILVLPIRIQLWCSGKLSDLNKWQSLSIISMSYCQTLFFCQPWRLLHINDSGWPKNSSRLVELVQVMSDVCLWVCAWFVFTHSVCTG